jgi:hypothetical protein
MTQRKPMYQGRYSAAVARDGQFFDNADQKLKISFETTAAPPLRHFTKTDGGLNRAP